MCVCVVCVYVKSLEILLYARLVSPSFQYNASICDARIYMYTWKNTLKYVRGSHHHPQTQIKNRREHFYTNPLWQISNTLSYCAFHTVFSASKSHFWKSATVVHLFPIYMADSEMPLLIDCVWMLRIVCNYFLWVVMTSVSSINFFWKFILSRVSIVAPVLHMMSMRYNQKG